MHAYSRVGIEYPSDFLRAEPLWDSRYFRALGIRHFLFLAAVANSTLIFENYPLLAVVILFAALLQAGTGFGFSVVATPLLLVFIPNPAAIQLNIILSIVLCIALFPRERGRVDWLLLRNLTLTSLAGIPFGLLLASERDAKTVGRAAGIVLLVITALLARRLKFTRTAVGDGITGFLSGLMTSGVAMPGPVLLVYFLGLNLDKATLRSTALCYFGLIYSTGLLFHISLVTVTPSTWLAALCLVPALCLGLLGGWRLFDGMSESSFRKVLLSILLLTGLGAVISSL